MTNERAIEILEDLSSFICNPKSLHWSASEIGKAIYFAQQKAEDEITSQVLSDYRDWLEFGQPFYHSLDHFNDAITTAIETLKNNHNELQGKIK